MTAHDILVRLLELTPPPPEATDGEIARMIAAFEAILAAREELLMEIRQLGPLSLPIRVAEHDRPLLVELERRQAAWHDRLAAVQRTVGEQRVGTERLRAYARTV
jgi:hypothetical protein